MPYFDYAATAPLRPEALKALTTASTDFGNAASRHAWGQRAERRVETARRQVAAWVGRGPREIVFTSGGTEADNLALLGVAARTTRRHLIVSAIEHRAVIAPARFLEQQGWQLDLLPVDADGVTNPDELRRLLRPDTALVSVMAVNNEMGALQPLDALAAVTREAGALFHTDAAQAGSVDLSGLDADLISLSAHKLGGPLGIGALVSRFGVAIAPIQHGGSHERGLRPGTLNVPAIAAFGAAAAALSAGRAAEAERIKALRDMLATRILAAVPEARRLGREGAVAPHILCLTFPGLDGESLVTQLDLAELAASSGAACTSLGTEPSPVLAEMGLDAAQISGSLRLSLGWATTEGEVAQAVSTVIRVVNAMLHTPPMAL